MGAFEKESPEIQHALIERSQFRIERFVARRTTDLRDVESCVLLVGERPGPSRPDDPRFHHTPFFDLKHCSLWLNLQLHQGQIPEERLHWVNAYNGFGVPTDPKILHHPWKAIVFLGGKAAKWGEMCRIPHGQPIKQVWHPQAWKRFKSKEPYPLIKLLSDVL